MNQMRYEELIEKYLKNDNLDLEKLIKDEGIAKDLAEKIYSEWKNYHDEVFWHNAIYEMSFMEEPPTPVRIMKQFDISYVFAKELYDYYIKVVNDDMSSSKNALLEGLEALFECEINEEAFNETISGQGDEKEKINSLYSSSCQSLLVFNELKNNKDKELRFKLGDTYIPFNKVYFEYKNKVIRAPSNVDVVLISNDNKSVLFIESKYNEIARDSVEGKNENNKKITEKPNTRNVVGVSYFKKGNNSYFKSLGLEQEELIGLGFDIENDDFGKVGYRAINPIDKQKYTYPYGIKQFLSHIIGIKNIFYPDDRCNKELMEYKNTIKDIYFLTIINSYPNQIIDSSEKKIIDYINHYYHVENFLLNKKNDYLLSKKTHTPIHLCGIQTYQELWENNKEYFKDLDKVVEFYKLGEVDTIFKEIAKIKSKK